MSWKRTAVFVVSGLIAVTVVVVAYVDKAKEPVWMEGARTLAPMPVTVGAADSLSYFAPQLVEAVHEINRAVGCRVLAIDSERPVVSLITPEVRDMCGGQCQEAEKAVGASTCFCRNGTIDVMVLSPYDVAVAYLTFMHELGHALGLAHDATGLMAVRPAWGPDMPLPLPTVSPKDAAALRERYCR